MIFFSGKDYLKGNILDMKNINEAGRCSNLRVLQLREGNCSYLSDDELNKCQKKSKGCLNLLNKRRNTFFAFSLNINKNYTRSFNVYFLPIIYRYNYSMNTYLIIGRMIASCNFRNSISI